MVASQFNTQTVAILWKLMQGILASNLVGKKKTPGTQPVTQGLKWVGAQVTPFIPGCAGPAGRCLCDAVNERVTCLSSS
jgi:hypothetical protein